MDVGNRIKKRRKQLHMSAEQLAAKIGRSPATMYRYEKGEIDKVDAAVLLPIADALLTTPAYLMGWEEESTEDAIWEKREALRRDPKRRVLFDLAENGTEKDIDAAVALLDALKATNPDFYDGDDPA